MTLTEKEMSNIKRKFEQEFPDYEIEISTTKRINQMAQSKKGFGFLERIFKINCFWVPLTEIPRDPDLPKKYYNRVRIIYTLGWDAKILEI